MSKLLNNAMVLALELMLQVFSNLLPENICFQQTILETTESGESSKAFMNDNLSKPNKHPTRAGP